MKPFKNCLKHIGTVFCLLSAIPAMQAQVATPPAYGSNLLKNYTREWDAVAAQQNPNTLIAGDTTTMIQTTRYSDGFDRPLQMVIKQASPAGNDMVTIYSFDTYGREQYKYLPFTANPASTGDLISDGNFKTDPYQQQVAFYNSYLNGQPGETNSGAGNANWAYAQKIFEASPLNRVSASFAPGVDWVGTQGQATENKQQQQFLVNTSGTSGDNVRIWNIALWDITQPQSGILPSDGGVYTAGQLYKTISRDEQGHQVIKFKDLYGQVILEKVQLSAAPDNGLGSGHAGWLCTYNVYDDNGNLRFVITPDVVSQMASSGSWNISQSTADELCYRYEYDAFNHKIVEKMPGKGIGIPSGNTGETWMIYDQRDRLVMKQDGNLRSLQKWQYIQYDNLDRITATGLITDPGHYNDLNYQVTNAAGSSNTAGLSAWPVLSSYSNTELLKQTFYDSYTGWMNSTNSSTLPATINTTASGSGAANFSTSYDASPYFAQPVVQTNMTWGQLMGAKTEVLGSNGAKYIYSVNFYDPKGRIVQTQSINITGGTDVTTTQYSWDGRPLAELVSHNKAGTNPQTHLLASTMKYDARGRLLTTTKSLVSTLNGTPLNSAAPVIQTNVYDELGRLKMKVLGNNRESLTYDYNVRGWLLGINRDYISGASTNNYFASELAFDKTSSVATGNAYSQPQFNGNVTGTVWKTRGDGVNRKYAFGYDAANRLLAAGFTQQNGNTFDISAGIDFSVSNLSYDDNGNIYSMNQNGFVLGGSQPIDNLAYHYVNGNGAGNKLLNVIDGVPSPNSTLGDLHYTGTKTVSSVDYSYDANGNVLSDYNRSISSIAYNYLDLPQQITFAGNRSIQYIYDAAGNKQQKITTESGGSVNYNGTNYTSDITTTSTYLGNFVYKTVQYVNPALAALQYTDVLQFAGHEQGRIRFKPACGAVPASYVFDYFIRDYQDNVRMVLTDEAPTDTYPAATLEGSVTDPASAVYVENQYYSINSVDIKPNPTWLTGSYVNNNGNPVNPNPNSVTTANSANLYWLNGQTGDKTGLGITLKVMAGDQLSISGKSVWHNTGTPAQYISIPSTLTTFLDFFAGTPAVVAGGHGLVTGASLDAVTAAASALSTMLSSTPAQSANTTYAPKAAINWILFDDQFKVVANGIGTDLVSSDPDVVKTHSLFISGIPPMAKNGYVYVYCSNESNIDVYFDNLQVVLTHGPILEETHYYPSGLTMAGISDKAWGKQANNFHFQGKEMQNREFTDGAGLEEYDFNTRYYDQQLGRWHNQDPAGQYASPYVGMGNSWPNGKDPNGQWFGWDDVIVSAVGFAIGYVGYGLEKGNWGGKALLSGAAGLAIAEGGYLTLGGGLAASSAAGVGGSGSIGAASSFAFSYGASDAGSLLSNKDQIHNSSDWGAFGLIAGYSLVSSISAGMSSENTGNAVDKFLEIKPDAMPGIEAVSLSEKGAAAAGYGGFISSVGNQVLQSYDPASNSWSLHWGRIFGKAIFEGYGASYIGKVVQSSFYIDDWDKYIPDSWQLGSNSSLLNWLYSKIPSATGALVSKGISAGIDASIPKW